MVAKKDVHNEPKGDPCDTLETDHTDDHHTYIQKHQLMVSDSNVTTAQSVIKG